jgi:hypothetical protein
MVTIVASSIVFIWVSSIVSFRGLDLAKRTDWIYSVYGFLCGFVIGIAIRGDIVDGIGMGVITGIMILFMGVVMRRNNQKYRSMSKSLVEKYEKEGHPSLLAKLAKKLLGRYK